MDKFNEIIAIRIGSVIYFGESAWEMLRKNDYQYDQLFSRAEFLMYSKLDLGKKWGDMADKAKTLFILPEEFRHPECRNPHPMICKWV